MHAELAGPHVKRALDGQKITYGDVNSPSLQTENNIHQPLITHNTHSRHSGLFTKWEHWVSNSTYQFCTLQLFENRVRKNCRCLTASPVVCMSRKFTLAPLSSWMATTGRMVVGKCGLLVRSQRRRQWAGIVSLSHVRPPMPLWWWWVTLVSHTAQHAENHLTSLLGTV